VITDVTTGPTDEDVQRYHELGFLVVDALTTEHEVVALQGVYDRLFDPDGPVTADDRYELAGDQDARPVLPQILNPDRYAPELRETTAYRNAAELARRLLGDEAKPMGMHAIRKPPRDGGETPWHQDEAYWDPGFEHHAISVWMPLQPATLDNGCMQFIAGSHRADVLEHRLINPESHGLVVSDDSVVTDPVPCPLPPGGATVHSGRTVHYAGPNTTDEPRRALIMAFFVEPRRLDQPRNFHWQRPEWSQ
jgi:hypothetical protein